MCSRRNYNCTSCHQSSKVCSDSSDYNYSTMNYLNKINKQTGMSSSHSLLRLRSLRVSRMTGTGADTKDLTQVGGPGDNVTSQTPSYNPDIARTITYRVPIFRRRTALRGKKGVDKKHGSYARFLSRRVGNELRRERMPSVISRTAVIKQPRNRTGTNCGISSSTRISTQPNNCLYNSARPQTERRFFIVGDKRVPTGYKDRITTYDKTKRDDPAMEACGSNNSFNIFNTNCCSSRNK